MPTPLQLKLIHIAYRKTEPPLNEAQYRTVLRNVAGVESAKQLTHPQFEDCMAVLEGLGFEDRSNGEGYWQRVVDRRSTGCNPRMAHLITELAAGCRYELGALCERFSGGRTDQVNALKPREAWMLIEMLKDVQAREVTR